MWLGRSPLTWETNNNDYKLNSGQYRSFEALTVIFPLSEIDWSELTEYFSSEYTPFAFVYKFMSAWLASILSCMCFVCGSTLNLVEPHPHPVSFHPIMLAPCLMLPTYNCPQNYDSRIYEDSSLDIIVCPMCPCGERTRNEVRNSTSVLCILTVGVGV